MAFLSLRSVKRRLSPFRDIGVWRPHGKVYYSQEGEDIVLSRMFDGQDSGFFVDVGAHHPRRFSNTYWAYQRGWRGVDIDATPGVENRFRRVRPRDIFVEACIAENSGTAEFFVFDEGALNTADPERSTAMESITGTARRIVRVPAAPLSTVLAQHVPSSVQTIDMMSIDVEGAEMDVLRSNDWNRYAPRVLAIEVLGRTIENVFTSPILEFLQPLGYVPVSMLYHSVILTRDTGLLDQHWGIGSGASVDA